MQGAGGNFYGATDKGGRNNVGIIFRMTQQGVLSKLFDSDVAHGDFPVGPLVEGRGGYLYGMTSQGGASRLGTIFKISRAGAIQTLHSFCPQTSCPAAWASNGGLVRGLDGWFYGTTCAGAGKGTVFRIGPHGTFEVLESFGNPHKSIGICPQGPLVLASDGNMYGINTGGAYGQGTIFMLTSQGQVKLFYSFRASHTDGWDPLGALIQGADGALYGLTLGGGANGWGTLFRISLQGAYQTIYDIPVGDYEIFGARPKRPMAIFGRSLAMRIAFMQMRLPLPGCSSRTST
jgi:uncharacterized repeat protein (TIGR03803 family)